MEPGSENPGYHAPLDARAPVGVASMEPGSENPGYPDCGPGLSGHGLASMEPGSENPGYHLDGHQPHEHGPASMEPGSENPGYFGHAPFSIRHMVQASMEPGSENPGYPEAAERTAHIPELQWSRGPKTPDTRRARRRSRQFHHCFNGAGVRKPRIPPRLAPEEASPTRASMEPGSENPGYRPG